MKLTRILIIVGATFLGVYVLFMGTYYATSQPSFCENCHLLRPYVTSWEKSPHKEVKCLYCHENRGFLGKIDSKARGTNNVYLWATSQYTAPTRGIVFQQNCLYCHLGDSKQFQQAPTLDNDKINHYEALIKGTSCLECHDEIGHKNKLHVNPEFKKLWK